jgi:hypothetical protein
MSDAVREAYDEARRYQPSKRSAPEWDALSQELREVIIRVHYAGQHEAVRDISEQQNRVKHGE